MGRFLATEVPRAVLRVAAALVIYGLVTAIPWPGDVARWIAPGAFAALATACLLICGTLLYNTFYPSPSQHRMYRDSFWGRSRQ